MSDDSQFNGQITTNGPLKLEHNIIMSSLVLSRALTSADDGTHTWTVTATQNGVSVSAALTVTIIPASSTDTPSGITLNPTNIAELPDTSPAGTMLTSVAIAMTEGTMFAGTVGVVDETGAAAPVTFMP
jgi:hypothetical protein